jgi:hypothetical protein
MFPEKAVARTQRVLAGQAHFASITRYARVDHDPVADGKLGHRITDLLDDAGAVACHYMGELVLDPR